MKGEKIITLILFLTSMGACLFTGAEAVELAQYADISSPEVLYDFIVWILGAIVAFICAVASLVWMIIR